MKSYFCADVYRDLQSGHLRVQQRSVFLVISFSHFFKRFAMPCLSDHLPSTLDGAVRVFIRCSIQVTFVQRGSKQNHRGQ